jgi:hypothetical protein
MRTRGAVVAAAVGLLMAVSCSSTSNHGAALDGGNAPGPDGSTSTRGGGAKEEGGTRSHTTDGGGTTGDEGGTTPKHDASMSKPPPGDASGGSCLGSSFLSAVGKDHLLVGGAMQAATAAMAPFDLQYVYISGGVADGSGPCTSCMTGCTAGGTTCASSGPGCAWWGCWQYDVPPPGDYVRTFASTLAMATPPQIPMITYYQLLQSSGVTEGAPEVNSAANDAAFMARYFADWRFLLKQIGGGVALLHVEPDFWGYAEQISEDATSLPAAVASANPTDCASLPNTIAGMGQCMIAMTRTYAPHALIGLHASTWSTNMDISLNTSASLDVATQAQKTAAFLSACGESKADFVVVETSDRDAGYYQTVEMRQTWWDATNATLPDFHQDFAWVTALTEALSEPALWWQTPLGNAAQNNTTNHYQDNRVDYFLAHMNELAAAHGVGAAFGAGDGNQTTPESDGGNFVTLAKAYFSGSGGGQALCQ